MPEIILRNHSASMQINTLGAYVDNLVLHGREVLFPKTSVQVGTDTKLRGGMHVCLPQFGPDSKNHLAQHGFGRTSTWQIRYQNESDVGLRLISTAKGYENVEWLLDYSLPNENEAVATLTVCNYGDAPVRTSPGFHPYFPAVGTQFDFNGAPYDADYIAHTEFVASPSDTHVAFDGLKLDIRTQNLPVYALWSDRNGQIHLRRAYRRRQRLFIACARRTVCFRTWQKALRHENPFDCLSLEWICFRPSNKKPPWRRWFLNITNRCC